MPKALQQWQQYPDLIQGLLLLGAILVSTISAWIIGIRMRRLITKDLGRKATDADLTSIASWMKVDEVEQRNEASAPYTGVPDKSGETVLGRAIDRLFAGYDYKHDAEVRRRESQQPKPRNPNPAVDKFRLGTNRQSAMAVQLAGLVVCFFIALIFSAADRAGWIPHTKVVTVTMTSTSFWTGAGTYCFSQRTSPPKPITSLRCLGVPDGPHDVKVTFWGLNDTQTDRSWSCEPDQSFFRKETSLRCTLQPSEHE